MHRFLRYSLVLSWFLLSYMGAWASDRASNRDDATGGWSGNGGGLYRVNDNVWYLGPEPIRYCLRVSGDFPIALDDARHMVSRSFTAWRQFFTRYRMGQPLATSPALPVQPSAMSLSSLEVDCQDKPELEFFLGLENEALRVYKQINETDGYGLALRRSYDHKTHRHQGAVWIPNFTRDDRKIEHMILHELGHVFGMKHDTVFVMDRDVASFLKAAVDGDPMLPYLGRVEADFWPFDLAPGARVNMQPYARQAGELPVPAPLRCIRGVSLAAIPAAFHPSPMPLSPCVQLSLRRTNETQTNNFQLTMETDQGQRLQTIWGTFQALESSNSEILVPGILSTWTDLQAQNPQWTFVPYGQRDMHAQLSGYFIRGQIRYPVKVSWQRGVTLEIFIPDQSRWWSIRSFRD